MPLWLIAAGLGIVAYLIAKSSSASAAPPALPAKKPSSPSPSSSSSPTPAPSVPAPTSSGDQISNTAETVSNFIQYGFSPTGNVATSGVRTRTGVMLSSTTKRLMRQLPPGFSIDEMGNVYNQQGRPMGLVLSITPTTTVGSIPNSYGMEITGPRPALIARILPGQRQAGKHRFQLRY